MLTRAGWPGATEAVADPAVGSRAGRPKEFVEGLDQDRLATAELRIEDKGAIQALHWRQAGVQEVARMQAQEVAQLAQAAEKKGPGDLAGLLRSNGTWHVNGSN